MRRILTVLMLGAACGSEVRDEEAPESAEVGSPLPAGCAWPPVDARVRYTEVSGDCGGAVTTTFGFFDGCVYAMVSAPCGTRITCPGRGGITLEIDTARYPTNGTARITRQCAADDHACEPPCSSRYTVEIGP